MGCLATTSTLLPFLSKEGLEEGQTDPWIADANREVPVDGPQGPEWPLRGFCVDVVRAATQPDNCCGLLRRLVLMLVFTEEQCVASEVYKPGICHTR